MTEVATAVSIPAHGEKIPIDTLAAAHDPVLELAANSNVAATEQNDAHDESAAQKKLEELETRELAPAVEDTEKGADDEGLGAEEPPEKLTLEDAQEREAETTPAVESESTLAKGATPVEGAEQPAIDEIVPSEVPEIQTDTKEAVSAPQPEVKEEEGVPSDEPESAAQPIAAVESEVKDEDLTVEQATKIEDDEYEAIPDAEQSAKEEEPAKITEPVEEQPAEEPVQSETPIQDEVSAPVQEPLKADASASGPSPIVETESKPDKEVSSEAAGEVEEPVKDEESVQAEEPAAIEEPIETEAPVSEPILESVSGIASEIDANPQDPEEVAPPAANEEHIDTVDAARKAYELVHVHQNDEVIADQPSDAETEAARANGVTFGTEELAASAEPETKDETADVPAPSESGIESVDSIPTETGETPSVVPEEQATPSIPEEVEAKDEMKESEPEVAASVSENANVGDVSAPETIVTEKSVTTVESKTIDEEETVDAVTALETSAKPEGEGPQEHNAEPPVVLEAENAAPPAATISSDEPAGIASEERQDILAEPASGNDASAHAEKEEEPVVAPAIDPPVEPNTDIVTEAPVTKEDNEPGSVEEPAIEVRTEDAAAAEHAGIVQEEPAPVAAAVETQEDVPIGKDTAENFLAENFPADQPTAIGAPASAEVESNTPETIVGQVVTAEDIAAPEEPALGKPAGTVEEVPLAEPIQESPAAAIRPTEIEESLAEPVEIHTAVEGGPEAQSEHAEDRVPASESVLKLSDNAVHEAPVVIVAEEPGPSTEDLEAELAPAEAIAGPGLEELAVPKEAEVRDEHAVESVQEGTPEQLSVETGEAEEPEVHVPSVEEPSAGDQSGSLEEPAVLDNIGAEAETSVPAGALEEPVEEATPATDDIAIESQAADEVGKVIAVKDQLATDEIGSVVEQSQDVEGAYDEHAAPRQDHQDLDSMEASQPSVLPAEESAITQEEDVNIDAQSAAGVEAISPAEEQPAEDIVPVQETQDIPVAPEEPVPDVQVEMPTPSAETLSFTTEENEQETGIPLEQRLAEAVGIPAAEIAMLPALSSPIPVEAGATASEDELTTPTEIKAKGLGEDTTKDEIPDTAAQDTEAASEILLSEEPDSDTKDEIAAPAGLSVDTDVAEAPERPKSPWTPSYSVTRQGSAPVHPEEPVEDHATEGVIDVHPDEAGPESSEESAVEVKSTLTESAAASTAVKEEQYSDNVLITPPVDAQVSDPVDALAAPEGAETVPSEEVDVKLTDPEEETTLVNNDEGHEAALETEVQASNFSDEVPVEEVEDATIDAAPATLSVNTSVAETPERPKSPFTPSYSVTTQGPGITEPDELELDADVSADSKYDFSETSGEEQENALVDILIAPSQIEHAQAPSVTEATLDIERPKSPYPPSYSVTQMGPGLVEEGIGAADEVEQDSEPHGASNSLVLQLEESSPTSPASESVAESVVSSNDPEAPSSPRSDLGIVTPSFDSRSEVSDASHEPIAPSSPRTDPDATSLGEAEMKTPLVISSEEQDALISPIQTPLILADKEIEGTEDDTDKLDTSEPLTESAVSGFDADVETDRHSTTTGSWIKDTDIERESHADSVVSGSLVSLSDENASENLTHAEDLSKEIETSEVDVTASISDIQTIQDDSTQAGPLEDIADITTSTPALTIPKLDVTSAPPVVQPVIVTNSMSTDSAYTQMSESISPSQETGTNVTTPDIETVAMPKVDTYAGSEIGSIEPLDEDTVSHVSDRPWSSDTSRTPTGTEGGGKPLGVAHTLAMRSFPSAFNVGTDSSALEQSKQAPVVESLDVDQLSPPSSRRRLESTTSSLVFPGGWVTSPSQKERASLEVATGVFSRPILEGTPVSPVVTPPAATTEAPSAEKENKWRCVIM